MLSEHTEAKRINILSYSAGGRVTSKALSELRRKYAFVEGQTLKQKFRIGSVIFAAADVEVDTFIERLTGISELAEQVVVTISDDDVALIAAKKYMGGSVRTGTVEAESIEIDFLENNMIENVELVDMSRGKEARGFDITGHHYWYRHPWASSDIIFAMRTNLPPSRRGLTKSEINGLWYLSTDYPILVKEAMQEELKGQW